MNKGQQKRIIEYKQSTTVLPVPVSAFLVFKMNEAIVDEVNNLNNYQDDQYEAGSTRLSTDFTFDRLKGKRIPVSIKLNVEGRDIYVKAIFNNVTNEDLNVVTEFTYSENDRNDPRYIDMSGVYKFKGWTINFNNDANSQYPGRVVQLLFSNYDNFQAVKDNIQKNQSITNSQNKVDE